MSIHYCIGHTEAVIAVSFSPDGRYMHVHAHYVNIVCTHECACLLYMLIHMAMHV